MRDRAWRTGIATWGRIARTGVAVAGLVSCVAASWAQDAGNLSEPSYTLRIVNGKGGPVQVRLGSGGGWVTLGKVLVPATRTAPGFGASRWARADTVAATAVHGIRIKVGNGEFPAMLSLVPREFTKIPDFYGGHIPGDSGIRTDIHAGKSLFREWAPLAGSPVRLETGGGSMGLPADYTPAPGDVLLISVTIPDEAPRSIVFENRKGGAVTATYADGTERKLGTVFQPVRGVGRFDGTSYTGVGNVNTNHPGVITIATAPVVETDREEGAPPERRGGFMVSPSTHVADQAKGMPQVMSVAPLPGEPGWEGRYPLFGGAIGLSVDPRRPASGYHAEMQVDGGSWEPLPVMLGRDDTAFTAAGLAKYIRKADPSRVVRQGVTAIRLTLPGWVPALASERIAAARKVAPTSSPEPTGVYRLVQGTVPVQVKARARSVSFLVDGAVRAASNDPGYRWSWDTTLEPNGRHWLEVRAEDDLGGENRQLRRVLVLNKSRARAAD